MKNYNEWMRLKSSIENEKRRIFCHAREVWWCSLGLNVGAEIDGKNNNYERPVLIMKVYNKDTLFVLPLTTKQKNDVFHYPLITSKKVVWAKLTQGRVVSNKRLVRKIDTVSIEVFKKTKEQWKKSI